MEESYFVARHNIIAAQSTILI